MQLPDQMVAGAQLSVPTVMHGNRFFKHNAMAGWKCRCVCFRVVVLQLLQFVLERRDVPHSELSSTCTAEWASRLTAKLLRKGNMAIAMHAE
jgi:hypothetical protein